MTPITDSLSVLRRRVRLLSLLQQSPISRFDAGEILSCDAKTIQRDIAWLVSHGVPITSEQPSSVQPALWSVPRRWSAQQWLWGLMCER